MSSESFRRQLQKESSQWRTEGLISPDQWQQLADRYQFDQLETDARDRFISILMIIGGLLLGIGVITFVAANWQAIPRSVRLLLLLALLVGANGAGFYLWQGMQWRARGGQTSPWRDRQQWPQRLGQGLLIFGALILGANLALVGQMFHQSGSAFGLCLVWGLGVLVMAYSLQIVSLGVMAALLFGIGFWTVVFDVSVLQQGSLLQVTSQGMPLVVGALFLPLAYQCRSRLLFAITALGVMSSFEVIVADVGDRADDASGALWAIALSLPVALLWAYHDGFWRRLRSVGGRQPVGLEAAETPESSQPQSRRRFQPVARAIAFLWLSLAVYGLSFNSWIYSSIPASQPLAERLSVWIPLLLNPNVWGLAGLAIALWVSLGWPRIGHQWRLTLTDGFILIVDGLVAGLILWHSSVSSIGVYGTLIFNVLLFLLAAGVMREGLSNGDRKQFWVGLVLLILQILSRVFEYDTGLIVKSLAFLLCGVAVIVIGLWFERYVRSLPSPQGSPEG